MALEDQRSYDHHGIDTRGLVWAVVGSASFAVDQGATITQQLAKTLYKARRPGVLAKAEQVGLAVKLQMTYSKAQILEMYLNAIYYGDGR